MEMAGERRINFGADATDARYRIEDTGDGANFVLAEDLDGSTVLLEYDDSATPSEWVVRGPVNFNSNDLTNISSVSTDDADITTHLNFPIETTSDVSGSRSTGTFYQNTTGAPLQVIVGYQVSAGNEVARGTIYVNSSQNVGTEFQVDRLNAAPSANESGQDAVRAIVPDQSYYQFDAFGDTANGSVQFWNEGNLGE